jgi:hypothetical protein
MSFNVFLQEQIKDIIIPLPPRAHRFIIGPAVINTHTFIIGPAVINTHRGHCLMGRLVFENSVP